jgi:hypothetical protein
MKRWARVFLPASWMKKYSPCIGEPSYVVSGRVERGLACIGGFKYWVFYCYDNGQISRGLW